MSQMTALSSVRDPIVRGAAAALGLAPSGEPGTARYKWSPRFDKVAVTNGGLSPEANTTFTFFTHARSQFVSNLPAPNRLTNRGVYRIMGIGFDIIVGGSGFAQAAVTAVPVTVAEALRQYYKGGFIDFRINGDGILDDEGIENYPIGGGPWMSSGVAATSGAAQIALINNGVPDIRARFYFPTPFDVTDQDEVACTVAYPAAIALPSGVTATFKVKLFGNELVNATK